MNAKAYRINAMSLCIGIYLNVYANKRSYDTWRGTSMLGRKARETLLRGHRRRVVLRVTQWNTGVAIARASGRQTARAKCVHQKRVWSIHNQVLRELAVNGSSHWRLLTITVGQEVLRNVVCLCFCSWACCRMLQISMRSMFLPCHCDCAVGDRFWEDMLVWCGSRPAVVKTRVL